jgi:hypothetical protein
LANVYPANTGSPKAFQGLVKFENPTNGSWWIVQVQPTGRCFSRPDLNNPPTAVGGIYE